MKQPKPTTDREMILSEDHWPKWPLLPMVKRANLYKGCPTTGVIVAPVAKDGKVYFAPNQNLYDFDEDRSIAEGYPIMVDDLLAEGWKVD